MIDSETWDFFVCLIDYAYNYAHGLTDTIVYFDQEQYTLFDLNQIINN